MNGHELTKTTQKLLIWFENDQMKVSSRRCYLFLRKPEGTFHFKSSVKRVIREEMHHLHFDNNLKLHTDA